MKHTYKRSYFSFPVPSKVLKITISIFFVALNTKLHEIFIYLKSAGKSWQYELNTKLDEISTYLKSGGRSWQHELNTKLREIFIYLKSTERSWQPELNSFLCYESVFYYCFRKFYV